MTAPELKPCPFCGGEASISKDRDPDGNGAFYAVKCRKCRAKSPEIYAVETCDIHFAQVRDAWNRRADLAAVQPAQVRVKPLGSDGVKIHPQDILNAAWRDDLGEEGRAMYNRILTALNPQPAPEALHRSFPDAGDGRPMPPMGDELMIAGLSVDDARFVAVQLAQNGLTLTVQPDPRDKVIARLVEAAEAANVMMGNLIDVMGTPDVQMCCNGYMCGCQGVTVYDEAEHYARQSIAQLSAAIAAAKGGV